MELVDGCRRVGVHIVHAPLVLAEQAQSPVQELAYLQALREAGALRAGSPRD